MFAHATLGGLSSMSVSESSVLGGSVALLRTYIAFLFANENSLFCMSAIIVMHS